MRYTLTYDISMYEDEAVYEEFETIDALIERYEEIKYDVCEIEAWDGDKKIAPWY